MPTPFPSPDTPYPVRLPDGTALTMNVFLGAVIDHPRISVGAYTYCSDFDPPADPAHWAGRIAPYLQPTSSERLVIGRFGQFAHGTRFITTSANHKMDGISTFPFAIHDPDRITTYADSLSAGRDTIVGHDVWIGMNSLILPGARIGNGVIVSAGSVVAGSIPDFAIVGGNRAKVIRMRFSAEDIARLNAIAWWDWPIDKIIANEALITGADIDALERA